MSCCEKCWSDAHRSPYDSVAELYEILVKKSKCTPEEQAGKDATKCDSCNRKTRHQWTKECMNTNCKK